MGEEGVALSWEGGGLPSLHRSIFSHIPIQHF